MSLRRRPVERASYVPLELHGIIGSGDKALVSITDATTRESSWVRVRDSKAKWYVESVNAKACSAVVSKDGMVMDLKMIRTTGEPMSITSPVMPQALGAEMFGAQGYADEAFDPQTLAAQILEFQSGTPMTPDQTLSAQFLGERLRAMTPEQRRQVSSALRANVIPSASSGGASSGVPSSSPHSTRTLRFANPPPSPHPNVPTNVPASDD
jgi:hypothetical protein